jgi:hypothetical protein
VGTTIAPVTDDGTHTSSKLLSEAFSHKLKESSGSSLPTEYETLPAFCRSQLSLEELQGGLEKLKTAVSNW